MKGFQVLVATLQKAIKATEVVFLVTETYSTLFTVSESQRNTNPYISVALWLHIHMGYHSNGNTLQSWSPGQPKE